MSFSRTRRILLIYQRESWVGFSHSSNVQLHFLYPYSLSLDTLSCPTANYLSGWSHGKEALKSGSYDTLKGSYYVNCAFYHGKGVTVPASIDFPEFTAPNVWPAETSLPGFRIIFEILCTLMIDTAVLVARACDRYAEAQIQDYEPGYLEHVVKTSMITKARLLHYFPPAASTVSSKATHVSLGAPASTARDNDSWCATHIDRKLPSLFYQVVIGSGLELQDLFQKYNLPEHSCRPQSGQNKVLRLIISRRLPNWLDVRGLHRRSRTPSSDSPIWSNQASIYRPSSTFPSVGSWSRRWSLYSRTRFYRHQSNHPSGLPSLPDRRSAGGHHKGHVPSRAPFCACWRSDNRRNTSSEEHLSCVSSFTKQDSSFRTLFRVSDHDAGTTIRFHGAFNMPRHSSPI